MTALIVLGGIAAALAVRANNRYLRRNIADKEF